jgi:hypothetical protein
MWGKSIAFTGVLNSRRHPRRRITRKMVFNCTMKHSVNVINTCRTLNNQLTPASTFQNIVINKYGRFNIEFDTKLRQLLSLKWKCDWIEMGICLFASALSTGGFFDFLFFPFTVYRRFASAFRFVFVVRRWEQPKTGGNKNLRLPFSKLICRSCCLALSAATLRRPWIFRRSVSVDDKLESCPPLGTFAAAAAAKVE